LASITNISNDSSGIAVVTNVTPVIAFAPSALYVFPLFDELFLTESDVGKTFYISSNSEDPDFSSFVDILTNGNDDIIGIGYMTGTTSYNNESVWFSTTPDFADHTITSIAITLDRLTLDSNGVGTDVSSSYSVGIWGNAVPEPPTIALLAYFAVLLLFAIRVKSAITSNRE
jgi:hypothetical protein